MRGSVMNINTGPLMASSHPLGPFGWQEKAIRERTTEMKKKIYWKQTKRTRHGRISTQLISTTVSEEGHADAATVSSFAS